MILFPHQRLALSMTELQCKVAYYLDMGLGKTFVGSEKMNQLGGIVNLVICQKSKVNDWITHFREHYKLPVYDLTNQTELSNFIARVTETRDPIIGVINYDLIFRRPKLAKIHIDTLMLDESSLIQNETSKRSKFILRQLKPLNVILLSGTPTGGKYEKLWSQCKLIGWDISKTAFWNTYVNYHFETNNGFPLKVIDGYKNVDRLKCKLREHGAVFMKSEEVFELPTQIDNDIFIPISKEYKKFKKDSIVSWDEKFPLCDDIQHIELVGDTALTKMLYERMLCGSYNKDKLRAFGDLLESTDDRIIVFYNFINELAALQEMTGDRPMSIVNGSTKDLTAYEDSENSVTFIQYQAGSMGLNLQKANKIIYFTPPLASELFEQSKKRIHRIGQERTCFYYYLTCKGSVEQKIYKTLAMRRDYTERLFEGGNE